MLRKIDNLGFIEELKMIETNLKVKEVSILEELPFIMTKNIGIK